MDVIDVMAFLRLLWFRLFGLGLEYLGLEYQSTLL